MLGEKIKHFRQFKRINQTVLAKSLEISQGFLSEVEQGKKVPGSDILKSLKQYFPDLNLNWLLADEGEMLISPGSASHSDYESVLAGMQQRMRLLEQENLRLQAKLEALSDVLVQKQSGGTMLAGDAGAGRHYGAPAAPEQKIEVLDMEGLSPTSIPALTPDVLRSLEEFVKQGNKLLEIVGGSNESGQDS